MSGFGDDLYGDGDYGGTLGGTYDLALLRFDRVHGAATLGWTAVLATMRLGLAEGQHEPVPVSTVSIADGYTLEQSGALSLDPATGTAQLSTRHSGPVAPSAALTVGDKVEVSYASVVLFVGAVTAVTASLEATGDQRSEYTNRATYTLASMETLLLSATVSWTALPPEDALTRLRRWFTVDTSTVSPTHASWLTTPVPEETEPGSAPLIDLARAFTAATLLPLRIQSRLSPVWNTLQVFDSSTAWTDQPLTITPGLDTAEDWATAAEFGTRNTPALVPTDITVKTNDMRFTGGQTVETIDPALLGDTFRLGVSRLGTTGTIPVGFRAPGVVDAFGTPAVVARIEQTFTNTAYTASLELAPTLNLPAERA